VAYNSTGVSGSRRRVPLHRGWDVRERADRATRQLGRLRFLLDASYRLTVPVAARLRSCPKYPQQSVLRIGARAGVRKNPVIAVVELPRSHASVFLAAPHGTVVSVQPGTCAHPAAARPWVVTYTGPSFGALRRSTWFVSIRRPHGAPACVSHNARTLLKTSARSATDQAIGRTTSRSRVEVRLHAGRIVAAAIDAERNRIHIVYASTNGSAQVSAFVRAGTCSRPSAAVAIALNPVWPYFGDAAYAASSTAVRLNLRQLMRTPYSVEILDAQDGDSAMACAQLGR
jgi:hypothetical protein